MSLTYKVKTSDNTELNFPVLDALHAGRYAYTMSMGAPLKDYSVWHVPGTQGNIVCDLGYMGNTIIATAIYAGDYATILALYEADKLKMNEGPCIITDTAGYTRNRCRLKDSREQMPSKGYSVNSTVYAFFTVNYVFDQHGTTVAPVAP